MPILIERPVGFLERLLELTSIRPVFLFRLMALVAFPLPAMVNSWARYNSAGWDPSQRYFQLLQDLTRAGNGGQSALRSGVMPTTFTDAELRGLKPPTLLLVGEHEVVNNARVAMHRAQELIPCLQAEVIPNARHMLPIDQPERVVAQVLQFLG